MLSVLRNIKGKKQTLIPSLRINFGNTNLSTPTFEKYHRLNIDSILIFNLDQSQQAWKKTSNKD